MVNRGSTKIRYQTGWQKALVSRVAPGGLLCRDWR
jgi:hypothetical protein